MESLASAPLNLPVSGKQKYFVFLAEDISNGTRADLGNGADFITIGKELINDREADCTGEIVAAMVKGYSRLPKDVQIKLGYQFVSVAKEDKVRKQYDHLVVDEILKVASGIKPDEDFRTKVMVLAEMVRVALDDWLFRRFSRPY